MFSQDDLKQFVGAEVQAKGLKMATIKGKIADVPYIKDDYVGAIVALENGKVNQYKLDFLEFEDAALKQKAVDISKELINSKKLKENETPKSEPTEEDAVTISISGKDKKIAKSYHPEFMSKQPVLTFAEVEEDFGVRLGFRGICTSHDSPNVVLVSVLGEYVDYFVYNDRWDYNGDYIYTGEGRIGDQKMARGNAAILNAKDEGKDICLFIKPFPNCYIYQGEFEVIKNWYEVEEGADGMPRKAIKFRLRRKHRN